MFTLHKEQSRETHVNTIGKSIGTISGLVFVMTCGSIEIVLVYFDMDLSTNYQHFIIFLVIYKSLYLWYLKTKIRHNSVRNNLLVS